MNDLMASYHIVKTLLLILVGCWLILFVWVETRK